jgi:hypothetical protein
MLTFEHPTTGFTGRGASRRYGEVPEMCPLCRHHVDPRRLTAHSTGSDDVRVDFTFQCPRAECRRVFVGEYRLGPDGEYDLLAVAPRAAVGETLPDAVTAIAPAFVELYGEAREAEARGLHQLAGVGMRRALELLSRDFAAREHPDREEEVRALPAGECIRRFVADPLVRDYAAGLPGLDGDEDPFGGAGEPDPERLRVLVRLLVNWLESVTLVREHPAEMAGAA